MSPSKIKPSSNKTLAAKVPFEQKLAPLAGPILLMALVAVSSFLLGKSYQSHLTPATTTVATDTKTEPSDSSTINDIAGAITNPPAVSSVPTASTKTSSPASSPTTSSQTPAKTAAPSGIVNINTADLTALETLNGIGPTKAKAIIDYRNQNGPFVRIDDLVNVGGIGPATMDKIRSQITV